MLINIIIGIVLFVTVGYEFLHGDWKIGCMLILIAGVYFDSSSNAMKIEALEDEVARLRKKTGIATEKQPYTVIS
jgi:hypothetical protein